MDTRSSDQGQSLELVCCDRGGTGWRLQADVGSDCGVCRGLKDSMMSKNSPSSEALRCGGVREKAQQACESKGQVPGAGGVAADSTGPCWALGVGDMLAKWGQYSYVGRSEEGRSLGWVTGHLLCACRHPRLHL